MPDGVIAASSSRDRLTGEPRPSSQATSAPTTKRNTMVDTAATIAYSHDAEWSSFDLPSTTLGSEDRLVIQSDRITT